jgi:hypothetical protein
VSRPVQPIPRHAAGKSPDRISTSANQLAESAGDLFPTSGWGRLKRLPLARPLRMGEGWGEGQAKTLLDEKTCPVLASRPVSRPSPSPPILLVQGPKVQCPRSAQTGQRAPFPPPAIQSVPLRLWTPPSADLRPWTFDPVLGRPWASDFGPTFNCPASDRFAKRRMLRDLATTSAGQRLATNDSRGT